MRFHFFLFLLLSLSIFFIACSNDSNPDRINSINSSTLTNETVRMRGEVFEYYWVKDVNNRIFALCHGEDSIVFKNRNSLENFRFAIDFKENVDIKTLTNQSITVYGDLISEEKTIQNSCEEGMQYPIGVCDGNGDEKINCYTITNAVIAE